MGCLFYKPDINDYKNTKASKFLQYLHGLSYMKTILYRVTVVHKFKKE